MRSYVVRHGDSPAKIAIGFAGCPKCAADLVAVNPHKPTVRYPNGFLTFRSLGVGERLNLPDKWFNGTLDRAPQSYFDRMPSADGGLQGLGVAPPGIPTPTPGGPPQPPGYTFQPLAAYTLTVWPIPLDSSPPSPESILQAMHFQVTSSTDNGDGSKTVDVIFQGLTNNVFQGASPLPFSLNPMDARSVVIVYNGGPLISPIFGSANPYPNPATTVPGTVVNIAPPAGGTWGTWGGTTLPGINVVGPPGSTAPMIVTLPPGTHTVSGSGDNGTGVPVAFTMQISANVGGEIWQLGETVTGTTSGATAQIAIEYDVVRPFEGTLQLQNVTGLFSDGETIVGSQSGSSAEILHRYHNVLNSFGSSGAQGLLGLSSIVSQGSSLVLPYDMQPGDQATLQVQPMLKTDGVTLSDPTVVLESYGFTSSDMTAGAQDPNDCSWSIDVTNNSQSPITISDQMGDVGGVGSFFTKALSVNGNIVKASAGYAPEINSPTMRACHSFSLTFTTNQCMQLPGGTYDPTVGLNHMGITAFSPPTSGPDELGQWTIQGVWDLADGFVLPKSRTITVTGFQDMGPAANVPTGACATSLPYTIQPGDSVNMIVRPIGVPGQPMTNPVAVLEAFGFTNVAPASTYSDCTWVMTGDYSGSAPLQITDPMTSPADGAMWIVGLGVNGTSIKDANWLQLQPVDVTLTQCNSYSILFTYNICPALTGAPGDWDPTAAIQELLPGFKVAPGPNEYGEWAATGVWQGQDGATVVPPLPPGPTSGSSTTTPTITFTLVIDYGPSSTCTPSPTPCVAPQVADTVTGTCVAACADGSAPANGVCGAACTNGLVADTVTGACVSPCADGAAPQNGVCAGAAAPAVTPPTTSAAGDVALAVGGAAAAGGLLWLILA